MNSPIHTSVALINGDASAPRPRSCGANAGLRPDLARFITLAWQPKAILARLWFGCNMISSSFLLAVTALTGIVSAQNYSTQGPLTVDPNSVPYVTRQAWCRAQLNTCPMICSGQASPNTCDPVCDIANFSLGYTYS